MGFFDKMRQAVGMDGVDIELEVPLLFKKDEKVVSGKVVVSAERPQSFHWVRVQLQREERESSHDGTNTTRWVPLSEWSMERPFSLVGGERREFEFQMVVGEAPSVNAALGELEAIGGLAAGLGKVLGAFDLDRDYRMEAKANVDGVVFDPTKHTRVAFE